MLGKKKPDVRVRREGPSIALIVPVTDKGRTWINTRVQVEDWQRSRDGVACEPRYAVDIIAGARAEGLRVEVQS